MGTTTQISGHNDPNYWALTDWVMCNVANERRRTSPPPRCPLICVHHSSQQKNTNKCSSPRTFPTQNTNAGADARGRLVGTPPACRRGISGHRNEISGHILKEESIWRSTNVAPNRQGKQKEVRFNKQRLKQIKQNIEGQKVTSRPRSNMGITATKSNNKY